MSGRQFGGCGLKGIGTRGGGSSDGFRKRKGLRGKGKQSALAERCPVPRIPYVVQSQAAQPPFLTASPPLSNSGNAKANSSDSSKELPPISDRSYRPGSKFEVNRRRHRPGRTIRANKLPPFLVTLAPSTRQAV